MPEISNWILSFINLLLEWPFKRCFGKCVVGRELML